VAEIFDRGTEIKRPNIWYYKIDREMNGQENRKIRSLVLCNIEITISCNDVELEFEVIDHKTIF
jgi:hypothetical protein